MDKLYLSIKEAIEHSYSDGAIPKASIEWEYGNNAMNAFWSDNCPRLFFKILGVEFENPHDEFPIGHLMFSIRILFDGNLNNPKYQGQAIEGFELLKKIPSLLKTIQTDETGPVAIYNMEPQEQEMMKHGYIITASTAYYPAFSLKF